MSVLWEMVVEGDRNRLLEEMALADRGTEGKEKVGVGGREEG